MKNYSTSTTNHRICTRLINFYKTFRKVYEYSIEQDGKTLDNGKFVDGYSITFYKLSNKHFSDLSQKAQELIKSKNDTERNITSLKSRSL